MLHSIIDDISRQIHCILSRVYFIRVKLSFRNSQWWWKHWHQSCSYWNNFTMSKNSIPESILQSCSELGKCQHGAWIESLFSFRSFKGYHGCCLLFCYLLQEVFNKHGKYLSHHNREEQKNNSVTDPNCSIDAFLMIL